jgi:hypothetical protein
MRVANPLPRYRSSVSVVLAALLLATACAPQVSTTQVLSADLPMRTPLRGVLVIGSGPGLVERHELEDSLAAQLTKRGIIAKASYELFPERTPTNEQAREAALRSGLDGILVSRLRDIERRVEYVPPSGPPVGPPVILTGAPYGGGGVTPMAQGAMSPPAHYVTEKTVEFETKIWEPRGAMTLWTGITQTDNPKSGKSFARNLAKEVIPQIEKAGFVPREP